MSHTHSGTGPAAGRSRAAGPATGPAGAHVVVVGGGISGLAAAHRLAAAGARVTLLEASRRLGGKLHADEIAGVPVDLGAESILARRPEAVDLAREVGLGDDLEPPAALGAALWTRGRLRPMPKGHVMGVPGDLGPLAASGVLSTAGLVRLPLDHVLPRTEIDDDVAVGAFVAARLGHEVVDRLVEPLLGGVYAGNAYEISLRAAVPQLYTAARTGRSLIEAVRDVQRRAAAAGGTGPVFNGIRGGIGRLPLAVADACRAAGVAIETGAPVRELRRTGPHGWQVRLDDRVIDADAVVLAAPAPAAARLLGAESPAAAADLDSVGYASMALVTMAYRRSDLHLLPQSSGFLVPPVDGRTIKASTFSSRKWGWQDAAGGDTLVLRTSVGRYGDEADLAWDDTELVRLSRDDLAAAVGLRAAPIAARVTRWDSGLPQYPVGHLDRVARIREHVGKLPGLAVCGALYDGVGIPACVGSGYRAASEVLATLPPNGTGGAENSRMTDSTADHAPDPAAAETDPAATEAGTTARTANAGKKAKDLNEVIRYTLWSVFRLRAPLPEDRTGYADEVDELFAQLADKDVTIRGTYDVSGLRADADLMVWWHAETAEALQEAYNLFRRTRLGRALEPVWSNMALHRPAEFNKSHVPAFLADETPRDYVSVYPFVRSYDWYLLPDEDRRRMLADHGKLARGYPDVRANTVASFSLGDYEWILAFEADELYRIVDLMRLLRASEARMHVREEVPFFTGRRRPVADLVAGLA